MATFREILTRLFTRNVIIKRLPGGRLKTLDVNKSQSTGSPTTFGTRAKWRNGRNFNSTSGYGSGFTNEEFEAIRKQMYIDYELMDTDSIVSAVLNILSDESTTVSETGELLLIKTDNVEIKKILHNLFYDVLNIEFNLWSWIRTTCKYGDSFLFLQVAEEVGVINVMPIHPSLMIREEGTVENPDQIRFRYEGDFGFSYGSKNYFEHFEVAHFRLLGDTNFLPYGKSYVEGARKEYKRMLLMEDAMLISRIMRAPERRTFKIDIGNIAPEDVDGYMDQIATEMKKTPYIDPATGDYDLRFNIQPIAWYSKIPLLDGRTITIKELSEEFESGKLNWVYSIDHENNNFIVPGRVSWCGLTKKDSEIVRIHLDDESYVDFEPSHPVMLRDGTYCCAKDIIENQSIMPFYTRLTDRKGLKGYEEIYNPASEKYEITHRLVATSLNIDNYQNTNHVVHHRDFKRLNNSPDNLDCSMTYREHIKFHSENVVNNWNAKTKEEKNEINIRRSQTHKENFATGKTVTWSKGLTKETDDRLAAIGQKMTKENNPERAKKIAEHHTGIKRPEHSQWMKDNFVPYERTDEHRRMLSEANSGENNANFGKTWEEIHGVEKASEMRKLFSELGKRTIQFAISASNTPEQIEIKRQRRIEYNKNRCSDPIARERHINSMKDRFDDYLFEQMISIIRREPEIQCFRLVQEMNNISDLYDYYLELNKGRKKPTEFKLHTIKRAFRERGFEDYRTFTKAVNSTEYKNHKVLNVEFLVEHEDVYCMTVEKYHNFAIDSHNGTDRNGIFVKNSSIEDYFLPVRGAETGTSIETLPGLQNDGMKEDLEYFKNKMIAALSVPKEYLGYADEGGGEKSGLAAIDLRFARTIERIQKIIVSELYKIAVTHLYVQGFRDEELLNFELNLTNPSLIYERQRVDIMTAKVDLIKSIREDNLFSDKYIYEVIMGQTEDEWKADRDQLIESAKFKFRMKELAEAGNDPEKSFRSYTTPYDLASLQVSSKLDVGNTEEIKKLYTPDGREENEGKPQQFAGSFETKRDQDFGRDPVGRRDLTKQESVKRIIKGLDKFNKKTNYKKTLTENTDLLNDDNLLDETEL